MDTLFMHRSARIIRLSFGKLEGSIITKMVSGAVRVT